MSLKHIIATLYGWKLSQLSERLRKMNVSIDALAAKIDAVVARLSGDAGNLAAVQAEADKAKADLAAFQAQAVTDSQALQAQIDALTAKLP